MSKSRRVLAMGLMLMLVAFVSACGKQPTEEINSAKAAVDAVFAEGGEKYAAEELKALNEAMNTAMAEVSTQDQKFFKNYDAAKEMVVKIKADAENLRAELSVRKEKAKNDATAARAEAAAALEEAKTLLGKAPRGKGSMADIEALKADVAGLDQSLTEVDGLMTSEDYPAALEKATSIKTSAAEVSNQVNAAIEMAKSKKKK